MEGRFLLTFFSLFVQIGLRRGITSIQTLCRNNGLGIKSPEDATAAIFRKSFDEYTQYLPDSVENAIQEEDEEHDPDVAVDDGFMFVF